MKYSNLLQRMKLSQARQFFQGLAAAEVASLDRGRIKYTRGYINKLGRFVIKKPTLDLYVAGNFQEGNCNYDRSNLNRSIKPN